jgi:uncharacterized protein (UPF0335 family)
MAEDEDEDLVGGGEEATSDGKARGNKKKATPTGSAATKKLKSFIERIERLDEEKKGISDDIREVFAEAKGQGFDTKAMRTVIKERKQDAAALDEFEAVLDLYRHALGMIAE